MFGADLAALIRELPSGPSTVPVAWYRLGDGHLGLRSELTDFHARFASRFAECECFEPPSDAPVRVEYAVRRSPNGEHVFASVVGGSLDELDFAFQLYALNGYSVAESPGGWTMIRPAGAPAATLGVSGTHVVASTRYPWRRFLANLAVNHVLSLQKHALFFHAGSVAIRGRGLMLFGPKGSGKTTLSLALASRGHAFNGDEIVGLDTRDLRLVPVPRAASVREGPRGRAVEEAMARMTLPTEEMPDGTTRHRVRATSLFERAGPVRAPLAAIVVLGKRRAVPGARRLTPRWEDIGRFAPLGCSLWNDPPGARAMQLLGVLGRVTCFALEPGSPDETARFLEELVETA